MVCGAVNHIPTTLTDRYVGTTTISLESTQLIKDLSAKRILQSLQNYKGLKNVLTACGTTFLIF